MVASLLLDAMQIVVPSQPSLQDVLRQLSPQPETPHVLNGHGHGHGRGHAHPYPHPDRINGETPTIDVRHLQSYMRAPVRS